MGCHFNRNLTLEIFSRKIAISVQLTSHYMSVNTSRTALFYGSLLLTTFNNIPNIVKLNGVHRHEQLHVNFNTWKPLLCKALPLVCKEVLHQNSQAVGSKRDPHQLHLHCIYSGTLSLPKLQYCIVFSLIWQCYFIAESVRG